MAAAATSEHREATSDSISIITNELFHLSRVPAAGVGPYTHQQPQRAELLRAPSRESTARSSCPPSALLPVLIKDTLIPFLELKHHSQAGVAKGSLFSQLVEQSLNLFFCKELEVVAQARGILLFHIFLYPVRPQLCTFPAASQRQAVHHAATTAPRESNVSARTRTSGDAGPACSEPSCTSSCFLHHYIQILLGWHKSCRNSHALLDVPAHAGQGRLSRAASTVCKMC